MNWASLDLTCNRCLTRWRIDVRHLLLTPHGIAYRCGNCGERWRRLVAARIRAYLRAEHIETSPIDGPRLDLGEVEGFTDWLDQSPDPMAAFLTEVDGMK